jgi:hypothetical protein
MKTKHLDARASETPAENRGNVAGKGRSGRTAGKGTQKAKQVNVVWHTLP